MPLVTKDNQFAPGKPARVRSVLFRYGIAVLMLLAGLLLRGLVASVFGTGNNVLPFLLPVVLSAWYGGMGPGLLSTALMAAVMVHLFRGSDPSGLNRVEAVKCVLFLVQGVFVSWFMSTCQSTQRWLAALVGHSDDAIVGKTLEGIVTSWNSGAEQVYGYTAREMIGRPITRLVPPDRLEEWRQLTEQVLRGEPVRRFETMRLRKDGQRIHVSLTLSPIKDATGAMIGLSAIARDITERKQAELALRESEERFRTMADTAPMIVWMTDAAGECTFCNHAWLNSTGQTLDQVVGQGWLAAVHADDRAGVWQTYEAAFQQRRSFTVEFRIRGADGEDRWLLATGAPRLTADNNFAGFIGSAMDITERKWAELALRGSRDELESEIEEQSAQLAEATRRLMEENLKRQHAEEILKHLGQQN